MKNDEDTAPLMLLGEKYAFVFLVTMYEANGRIKMSDLYSIAQSRTVDSLTTRLAQEGIITKKLEKITYSTTFLELTPKGRAIAEKLKEAFDILQED